MKIQFNLHKNMNAKNKKGNQRGDDELEYQDKTVKMKEHA